jgi:hypothetical protein
LRESIQAFKKRSLPENAESENRSNVVRYVLTSDAFFLSGAKTQWHGKQIVHDQGKITTQ